MKTTTKTKNIHNETLNLGDIIWYFVRSPNGKGTYGPVGFVTLIERFNPFTTLVTIKLFNPQAEKDYGNSITRHEDHFTKNAP
jgi:hypothetical protein